MRLGTIERKYAKELISSPMKEMGVTFENEQLIINKIIEVSSCHPNIIQYTCESILKKVNIKDERHITLRDVEEIVGTDKYYDYYNLTLWGQVSSYEKLIVYLMLKVNAEKFSQSLIREEVEKNDISTVNLTDAINTLELYSLIEKENDHYTFKYKYLSNFIKKHEDIEDIIDYLKEEIKNKLSNL